MPGKAVITSLFEVISNSIGTGKFYVGFNKPQGGDAINFYEITWYSEINPWFVKSSGPIIHIPGQTNYSFITTVLTKGSVYWFTVKVTNSGGVSTSSISVEI